jgi:signal transduction histidine kinase
MRLAAFITDNIEPILVEWEAFARSIPGCEQLDKLALRDHAEGILTAVVLDMNTAQTDSQQSEKSKGEGSPGRVSRLFNRASETHAAERVNSGFDLLELISEYRALRASVIRLWMRSSPLGDPQDLDDVGRFNESIDQSLATATRRYDELVERGRQIFLAILGHDLRNPLSAIKLSAYALSEKGESDPDLAGVISGIVSSATAMDHIIKDLLAFAGGKLGSPIPLLKATVDLRALCREVVGETRAAFPQSAVLFDPPPAAVVGEWDPNRLRQVVSNLLGNAIQHGGGTVEVVLENDGPDVLLLVRNDGTPIPKDILPTIFNPLVRAGSDIPTRRQTGSLGLGLYIAREVVTQHGGDIAVESSPGAGTVFTVRLPRHAASQENSSFETRP